ncbi:amidohydrolase [Candidatus Bathyarchaeota archaeon A05DMB-5]|nr:amidohydrolase [Candidatus Bathyarchaeota archaeon A05DMB-5]
MNQKQPRAEAVAIHNEKIVAVGSNKEIRRYIGNKTEVINAKNKTVIPGLVDCHVHMTSFGQFPQTLDLRNVQSIKAIQQKLRDYACENSEKSWILGGRWDQEKFAEKRLPTRWDLDAAVADKPVFLTRVCGHIAVANTKALQLAGITKEIVVEGGKIDLDRANGEPNGILRESAMELVWKCIPKPTRKELEEACVMACERAVEAGLTGVHWLLNSAEEMRIIQKLYAEGKLPLRVYLGFPLNLLDELISLGLLSGFGNDMIKVGFVKLFADGSLGARTAALKQPYADKPETCGIMLYSQRKLNRLVLKGHKAGLQLAVHAIGDCAVEAVLKAYGKALRVFPRVNHRHRIEHCSVLNPQLIRRMKRLGLVASVQPHFVVSDFWVVDRVGNARARWVYPFKTLVKEGLVVVAGSDCPVEPISPLLGVWAAVARKSFPEEKLSVEEALRAYTVNAAFASFDEDKRGLIAVGKFADLVVLSDDLFEVSPDKIRNVAVEMVIVAGKVVYARKQLRV